MSGYLTLFIIGLVGSVHCASMCGGITCALNLALHQSQREKPLTLALCVMGYQAGRILSYMIAGALVAGLAGAALAFSSRTELLMYGHLIQALVLILLGLYLSGIWRGPLAALERLGLTFWQFLSPVRKRVFPVRGPSGALAMGMVWGWLPCGLTYSALVSAMASAEPGTGALYMLMFGLGTLPALLSVSGLQRVFEKIRPGGALRGTAGGILIVLGLAVGTSAVMHA